MRKNNRGNLVDKSYKLKRTTRENYIKRKKRETGKGKSDHSTEIRQQ